MQERQDQAAYLGPLEADQMAAALAALKGNSRHHLMLGSSNYMDPTGRRIQASMAMRAKGKVKSLMTKMKSSSKGWTMRRTAAKKIMSLSRRACFSRLRPW